VEDGPGLRTVVFLKGCNLGCPWCHNPEGRSRRPEIGYERTRCIACGACAETCLREWSLDSPEAWRRGCTACGRCAATCPTGARRLVGTDYEPDALVAELIEDRDFFTGTGGGVTFSGGEPLLQPEFVLDCAARLAVEQIHVAVETAGLWPARLVAPVAAAADLVLFDLKHCDPDALVKVMSKDCHPLLDNLDALLAHTDLEIEIRVTLVPGFNASEADLGCIADWLGARPRMAPVRVQPFHRMAAAKASLYAVEYPFAAVPPLPEQAVRDAAAFLAGRGLPVIAD